MKLNKKLKQLKLKTLLGITILPIGESSEWTDDSFTEAYQKAKEGNITVAHMRHSWSEIEPSLGNYDWDGIDYDVYKAGQQDMKYSLIIEVIHTNTLGKYPQDISFTKFDSSDFVDNFKVFIRTLLNRHPGKIDYLWIGNEVDCYLHDHQGQIAPFVNFYQKVKNEIKSIDPNITVGIVGAYHLARNNNEMGLLQDFAKKGDTLGLTLYIEDDHTNPTVSNTESYFDELVNLFPDTKIAIIETAWSSRGPNGSEIMQVEYIKEISKVIGKYGNRFVFFSWFNLYDFSELFCRKQAESYGADLDTPEGQNFLRFLCSVGLSNNNGSEKPVWQVWKEYMLNE